MFEICLCCCNDLVTFPELTHHKFICMAPSVHQLSSSGFVSSLSQMLTGRVFQMDSSRTLLCWAGYAAFKFL